MIDAICISCGGVKSHAWQVCPHCGLDVEGDERAKLCSVYLSISRFQTPEEQSEYRIQLQEFGKQLAHGDEIEFDNSELVRIAAIAQVVDSVSGHHVAWAVLEFLWPGVCFLLLLMVIWMLLEWKS